MTRVEVLELKFITNVEVLERHVSDSVGVAMVVEAHETWSSSTNTMVATSIDCCGTSATKSHGGVATVVAAAVAADSNGAVKVLELVEAEKVLHLQKSLLIINLKHISPYKL